MTSLDAVLAAVTSKLTGPNAVALLLLLASSIIASAAMFLRAHPGPHGPRAWVRYAFPREILAHPSARADFFFWVTRKLLMPLLLLPTSAAVIAAVGYAVHATLGLLLGSGHHSPGPAGPGTILLFTVTALLAYDLSYYLYHRAQHRWPVLWELHKVHHSAEVMVGITKDRIHPLDEIMNRAWDGLVVGTVYGIWLFFAVDLVEATVLGINVYVLRNILMMDLVRHTHLKVSFGPLNHVVLCPHWHQLHHSVDPKHHDRNFGLMLSVWDRLFGTLAVPARGESFTFGIGDRESREYQSLYGLYVLPLLRMGATLLGRAPATGPTAGSTIRLDIVTDQAGLDALAPAWRALEDRAGSGLFQSHAWIAAWWRTAGAPGGFRLRLVAAWEGDRLVGLLPLALRRHGGLRVLEWAAKDCTDYCDALLQPGYPDLPLLLWRAAVEAGGFDLAYLSHLRPGAAMARFARGAPAGLALSPGRRRALATGVQLGEQPDAAAFFQALGKKGRNNHLRGQRILEHMGPVRCRLAEPSEAAELTERLRALKLDWLRREGQASPVLADDGSLLRALAGAAAARGSLRLFALEAGDRLAAGLLCFAEGRRLAAYLTAYDAEFGRASPGSIVLVEAIRWAAAAGFTEVDFLCGDEAYKGRLANATCELGSLVHARTLLGRLALWLDAGAGNRFKAWLERFRTAPARHNSGPDGALASGWSTQGGPAPATRHEAT